MIVLKESLAQNLGCSLVVRNWKCCFCSSQVEFVSFRVHLKDVIKMSVRTSKMGHVEA